MFYMFLHIDIKHVSGHALFITNQLVPRQLTRCWIFPQQVGTFISSDVSTRHWHQTETFARPSTCITQTMHAYNWAYFSRAAMR